MSYLSFNIALSGKAASGKSYVAKLLELHEFKRIAIARPLRTLAIYARSRDYNKDARALIRTLIPGDRAAQDAAFLVYRGACRRYRAVLRDEEKPRAFLCAVGESGILQVCPDALTNYLLQRCNGNGGWVCDDVRRIREANALRAAAGAPWKLVRLDVAENIRRERIELLYGRYDPTIYDAPLECELDDYEGWDYRLPTGVPLEEQSAQVLTMLESWGMDVRPVDDSELRESLRRKQRAARKRR